MKRPVVVVVDDVIDEVPLKKLKYQRVSRNVEFDINDPPIDPTGLTVDEIRSNANNSEYSEITRIRWWCALTSITGSVDKDLEGSMLNVKNKTFLYSELASTLAMSGHHQRSMDLLVKHQILDSQCVPVAAYRAWILYLKNTNPHNCIQVLDKLIYDLKIFDPPILRVKVNLCANQEDFLKLTNFMMLSVESILNTPSMVYLILTLIKIESFNECYELVMSCRSIIGKFSKGIVMASRRDPSSHLILQNVVFDLMKIDNYDVRDLCFLIFKIIPVDNRVDLLMDLFRPMIQRKIHYIDKFLNELNELMDHTVRECLIKKLIQRMVKIKNLKLAVKFWGTYVHSYSSYRLEVSENVLTFLKDNTLEYQLVESYYQLDSNRSSTKMGKYYAEVIEKLESFKDEGIFTEHNWRNSQIITMCNEYKNFYSKKDTSGTQLKIFERGAGAKIQSGQWQAAYRDIIDLAATLTNHEMELSYRARRAQVLLINNKNFDALREALSAANRQPQFAYTNALSHYIAAKVIENISAPFSLLRFYFVTMAYAYAHQLTIQTMKYALKIKLRQDGGNLIKSCRASQNWFFNFNVSGEIFRYEFRPAACRTRTIIPAVDQSLSDELYNSINELYDRYLDIGAVVKLSLSRTAIISHPILMCCKLMDLI